MKSHQKQFADLKFEEGLQTIRSRLTHLQNSRRTQNEEGELNSNSHAFQQSPAKNSNFMGKLKGLEEECEILLSAVQESLFSQKVKHFNTEGFKN